MEIYGNLNTHGDNSQIYLNCNPDSRISYNGLITNDYAYHDVQFGDILYYDLITKTWKKARADSNKTLPARGVACSDSNKGKIPILLMGFIYYEKCAPLSKPQLWLSDDTYGQFTDNQPSTIGHFIQTLGYARTDKIMYFDFCPFYIEIG